jgi:hypothetical protein
MKFIYLLITAIALGVVLDSQIETQQRKSLKNFDLLDLP